MFMGISVSKPGGNIGPEIDEDDEVEALGLMRGLNRLVRRIGGLWSFDGLVAGGGLDSVLLGIGLVPFVG